MMRRSKPKAPTDNVIKKLSRLHRRRVFNKAMSEWVLVSTAGYIGILIYEAAFLLKVGLFVALLLVIIQQED